MVAPLRPGKFYGASLPRPRIYTDVKFNDHRVDPPIPVSEPFMSWAQEAHWSMGGLSFNRLRLQGKIEGNVDRLRSQREAYAKAQARSPLPGTKRADLPLRSKRSASDSPSPPPPPVAVKRRKLMALINEEEEEQQQEEHEVSAPSRSVRRRLVKKLDEDFDRVASENAGGDVSGKAGSGRTVGSGGGGSDSVGPVTRKTRRLVKVGDAVRKIARELEQSDPKGKKSGKEGEKRNESVSATRVRTSPRLAKRTSN